MPKLKPRIDFKTAVKHRLSHNALNLSEVMEFSKRYDISEADVLEFIEQEKDNSTLKVGMTMSKDQKDAIYNMYDQVFIDRHPNLVIYRRGENVSFYEYLSGVYSEVIDMEYRISLSMLDDNLLEHRTSGKKVRDTITRIGALLSSKKDRHFVDIQIANQKWFLNLRNGLLDMSTLSLVPHTPSFFSTTQVPFDFDPKAETPLFDKFIEKVSQEDVTTAQMIQEMYGYCLLDGNPRHKVFYLYGNTARNGKSTTAKILCGLIGLENTSSVTLEEIALSSPKVLTLVGKQINYSDELSSKYLESSQLTSLSSEGTTTMNPKYKSQFQYQVKSKFLVACNNLPRFNEPQGMKNRMICIPFNHHFKEEDRILSYHEILLKEEGSGILNWALKGIDLINKNNGFSRNKKSLEDMREIELISQPVFDFMESNYDISEDYTKKMFALDLYGSREKKDAPATGYIAFCLQRGIRTSSYKTFCAGMTLFADQTKSIKKDKDREGVFFFGLRLKSLKDDDEDITNLF